MSCGVADVYYQPEEFGLTPVAEIEPQGLSWEFDIFAVWKNAEGDYFWASDSGCSCPSPFEDFTSLESLSKGTKQEALKAGEAWRGAGYSSVSDSDWVQFAERVMA